MIRRPRGPTRTDNSFPERSLSRLSPAHRVTMAEAGTRENRGPAQEDIHPRLAGPAALRAQLLLRQQFGDLTAAREVLARLAATLEELGQAEATPGDTERRKTAPTGRRRTKEQGS